MKSKWFSIIGMVAVATVLASTANAETRLLSWNAVSTYTDGTPIESGITVRYTVCWSHDPWSTADTLRTLVSSTTATSASFEPEEQGMSDFDTVYFSVKTVLDPGTESTLSEVLPWNPPSVAATAGIPTAPAGLEIRNVSTSSSAGTWEVYWNPVSRDTNGGTLESNAVRYTLYWTTDAALSPASLTPLASSIAETSFAFRPDAEGMENNQRVFFAARTVLTTGEKSALSSSLSWKTSNKGPGAPGNGRMKKSDR